MVREQADEAYCGQCVRSVRSLTTAVHIAGIFRTRSIKITGGRWALPGVTFPSI